jgi:type IV secretory pathway VirB4 component
MSDNALAKNIVPHLERWVEGGQYADVFDNDEDTLTHARVQSYEFEALEEYPEILEPFLFYALHRATVDLTNSGEYGIFVLDEAWKFLLNETVRQYLFRALKTWRKKRADVWIATQSIDDMAQTNMLRAVAENSGWVVLLPNPRMDREQYKTVFKLNGKELDLVATMAPKSEGLWKPAVGPSKVVILDEGGKK